MQPRQGCVPMYGATRMSHVHDTYMPVCRQEQAERTLSARRPALPTVGHQDNYSSKVLRSRVFTCVCTAHVAAGARGQGTACLASRTHTEALQLPSVVV